MLKEIIVEHVTLISQMIVYKIVLKYGVVMILHVQIAQVFQMVML